ncbi:MAG: PQQ-like beta-propeller repeat protein [Planctomycetes bacterium]|nr:PQQ-like beta-propeller repeat protein [Planctomycetota bacterium]
MLAALLLALALQDPAPPDLGTRKAGVDWPGFLGPNHDGSSPERGVAPWPPAGPRRVWERELAESYATCSIQHGRLFLFDRPGPKFRLVCLKAETGEPIWSAEYDSDYADGYGAGNGPRCCPVVDDDRVYTFGPEGLLHCFRTADGKVVWKKNTSEEFGVVPNFFGVGSTPIIEGDLLIAMVGGSPPGSPNIMSGETKGAGSGVVAFDKRSGALKYKLSDELASYASPLTTTINGRRWGFVFARGGLVGFEPATGKVDFHYPWRARSVTTVNIANPVVAGDLVLVSEAYGVGSAVIRVRPGAAEPVWEDGRKRDRSLMAYWNTPVQAGGFVYGSNGMNSDADLRCVEMATGKVRWSSSDVRQCSLLGVDSHLVGLGEDGILYLIKANPDKCEVLSRTLMLDAKGGPLLQSPARAAPVLSHGLLYLRASNRLVCLELIK